MTNTKMKLWWIPQVPMKAFEVDVANLDEGVKLMNVLADYDLFQFENHIKPDYCNTGGLQVLTDDGEWEDWYDEETGEDDPCRFVEERDAAEVQS